MSQRQCSAFFWFLSHHSSRVLVVLSNKKPTVVAHTKKFNSTTRIIMHFFHRWTLLGLLIAAMLMCGIVLVSSFVGTGGGGGGVYNVFVAPLGRDADVDGVPATSQVDQQQPSSDVQLPSSVQREYEAPLFSTPTTIDNFAVKCEQYTTRHRFSPWSMERGPLTSVNTLGDELVCIDMKEKSLYRYNATRAARLPLSRIAKPPRLVPLSHSDMMMRHHGGGVTWHTHLAAVGTTALSIFHQWNDFYLPLHVALSSLMLHTGTLASSQASPLPSSLPSSSSSSFALGEFGPMDLILMHVEGQRRGKDGSDVASAQLAAGIVPARHGTVRVLIDNNSKPDDSNSSSGGSSDDGAIVVDKQTTSRHRSDATTAEPTTSHAAAYDRTTTTTQSPISPLHCYCRVLWQMSGHVLTMPPSATRLIDGDVARRAATWDMKRKLAASFGLMPYGSSRDASSTSSIAQTELTPYGLWTLSSSSSASAATLRQPGVTADHFASPPSRRKTEAPRLLLMLRNKTRLIGEPHIIVELAQRVGFDVHVMTPEFETVAMQVRAARYADVMVGMHGQALTWMAMMDGETAPHCRQVIELRHYGRKFRGIHNVYELLAADSYLYYHSILPGDVQFFEKEIGDPEMEKKLLLKKSFPHRLGGFFYQTAYYSKRALHRTLQEAYDAAMICAVSGGWKVARNVTERERRHSDFVFPPRHEIHSDKPQIRKRQAYYTKER